MKILYVILVSLLIYINTLDCRRYLLYDVFQGEGFNLRRDVYIRVANTLRFLRDVNKIPEHALAPFKLNNLSKADWVLVLPPWGELSHWFIADETFRGKYPETNPTPINGIPWSQFFDLSSLSHVIPVMDLYEFQREVLGNKSDEFNKQLVIDLALQLVREPEENATINNLKNKPKIDYCDSDIRNLYRYENQSISPMELYDSSYFDENNNLISMSATKYDCIKGELEPIYLAPFIRKLIENSSSINTIYLGSAQTIIHGHLSEWSAEYWTVRRSMTFSKQLRDAGDNFRAKYLDSFDWKDRTVAPLAIESLGPSSGWLNKHWPLIPAYGGPYIGVHWRRGDFLLSEQWGLSARTPSSRLAAKQILYCVEYFNQYESIPIDTIYLATDATNMEITELTEYLKPLQLVYYHPSPEEWQVFGPGGLAIIDQWICAHARYFIGTNPSTFTFRIIEERSIMGFLPNTTFHTLCPDDNLPKLLYNSYNVETNENKCDPITPWPVVYEKNYTLSSSSSSPPNQSNNNSLLTKDEL